MLCACLTGLLLHFILSVLLLLYVFMRAVVLVSFIAIRASVCLSVIIIVYGPSCLIQINVCKREGVMDGDIGESTVRRCRRTMNRQVRDRGT